MAKVAKPKKRESSVHSRAHRRNVTPPTEVKARTKSSADEGENWMFNAQSAGVHKKAKPKKLTRQQRLRQAQAVERADRNVDKLERKVAESKQKGRNIQARAKDWDELNDLIPGNEVKVSKTLDKPVDAIPMDGIEEQPPVHGVANNLPSSAETTIPVAGKQDLTDKVVRNGNDSAISKSIEDGVIDEIT